MPQTTTTPDDSNSSTDNVQTNVYNSDDHFKPLENDSSEEASSNDTTNGDAADNPDKSENS